MIDQAGHLCQLPFDHRPRVVAGPGARLRTSSSTRPGWRAAAGAVRGRRGPGIRPCRDRLGCPHRHHRQALHERRSINFVRHARVRVDIGDHRCRSCVITQPRDRGRRATSARQWRQFREKLAFGHESSFRCTRLVLSGAVSAVRLVLILLNFVRPQLGLDWTAPGNAAAYLRPSRCVPSASHR